MSEPGLEKATLVLPSATEKNKKQKILCKIIIRIEVLFINIEVKNHNKHCLFFIFFIINFIGPAHNCPKTLGNNKLKWSNCLRAQAIV
jgi:hypothetical protein